MMRVRQYLIAAVTTFIVLHGSTGLKGDKEPGEPVRRIEHLVVIIQENSSFDHYFATYPHAANLAGDPVFVPRPGTPSVNGLGPSLLKNNQIRSSRSDSAAHSKGGAVPVQRIQPSREPSTMA